MQWSRWFHVEKKWRQAVVRDGGRPSKAVSNCRMGLLFTVSPTSATRKTGQNCLSAEFKTPRNITDRGRHAAGTLPGQNPAFLTTSGGSRLTTKPQLEERHMIRTQQDNYHSTHWSCRWSWHTGPLSPVSNPTDVKIRAGSRLSLPPGSVLMLSLIWKSHCLSPLHFSHLLQSHFEQWHIPSSKTPTVLYSAPPFLKARRWVPLPLLDSSRSAREKDLTSG